MSLPSAIVVTATLALCFPDGSSQSSLNERCAASLSDEQLAGSVASGDSGTARLTALLAEMQGRDQMRLTAGIAGLATHRLLSELELEAMAEAAHGVDAAGPGSSLPANGLIVNGPGGTAIITTDIRMGEIRMDGLGL